MVRACLIDRYTIQDSVDFTCVQKCYVITNYLIHFTKNTYTVLLSLHHIVNIQNPLGISV